MMEKEAREEGNGKEVGRHINAGLLWLTLGLKVEYGRRHACQESFGSAWSGDLKDKIVK